MTRQRLTTAFGMTVMAVGLVTLIAGTAGASDRRAGAEDAQIATVTDGQAAPEAQTAPSELVREGMAKMLQALNKLIESVPQYQMPEMTENGDIILRRKRPDEPVPPAQQPAPSDNRAI